MMKALPHDVRVLVVLPAKDTVLADACWHRWVLALQGLAGFEVVLCTDAQQSVQCVQRDVPDVLIQGMHMEGAHGLDMLRHYRRMAILKDVPIVLCDVRQRSLLRRCAFAYGAADVMAQPWDMLETKTKLMALTQAPQWKKHCSSLQYQAQQQTQKIQHLQQQLKRASSLDTLTKLPSRPSFAALYEREWQRALRETEALSLLLIDVDCFRAYNDAYGYQSGDAALQTIAQRIADMLQRPSDVCARYSGASFMVLLPVTHAQGGIVVAERMRQAVMGLAMAHRASETADVVTVSIGLVTTCPMMKHQPRDMIRMVERACFEAKQQGRNCLVCKSL